MSLAETQTRPIPARRTDAGVPPRSAVPIADGLAGLASVTLVWMGVLLVRPPLPVAAWLLILATALPMLVRELSRHTSGGRTSGPVKPLVWLLGLVIGTMPFLLIHGQHTGLVVWSMVWVIVAPAFLIRIGLELHRNGSISGGLPNALGEAIASRDRSKFRALAAPARLWALKAFFIPLYTAALIAMLSLTFASRLDSPLAWLGLAVSFAYTVDLCFGLSGYLMASNRLVPTIRSTQPRLLGWLVCVVCYGPIVVHLPQLDAILAREITWPKDLGFDPLMIVGVVAMLALLVLFVSATVSFGLRFCNLSNRGLISSGPYRWMKHPAYLAHAGNAWIITYVFLPAEHIALGPAQLLAPVALTAIYWLRALTEEQHLREDPDYVAYADWIARHGLVARLRRLLRLS
jgi:protein-S-isoprenylcysteine O-methyltransferase Ste14